MTVRILIGDVRAKLAELADESVHCVVTSPPYFGLRDYGLEPQVWGGDADCDHEWGATELHGKRGKRGVSFVGGNEMIAAHAAGLTSGDCGGGQFCRDCNAWRGSFGLEPTPDLYIEHMVGVFHEVRRVMRKDATLWLNMGDSYAGSANGRSAADTKMLANDDRTFRDKPFGTAVGGLKPKDLCMMPARLALALQADGWWLRQEVVWAKGISFCSTYSGSCMPESCRDRPTTSHEKVFLMTKAARYFYDMEAVKESDGGPHASASNFCREKEGPIPPNNRQASRRRDRKPTQATGSRNLRSVWAINPQPFPEAHFATFPERLVEPCIMAGTSEKGCCPECGAPWV
ncbi:hypothetical protein LCGC14_2555630, partial [marine sediment metagenome]